MNSDCKKIILINEKFGQAILFKNWLPQKKADELLQHFKKIKTVKYQFKIGTSHLKENRYIYAFGDNGVYHTFANIDVPIHKWSDESKFIRDAINEEFGVYTNFGLLNHFKNGQNSIPPHSDGELYAKNKSVFTLSLGTTRLFVLGSREGKRAIKFNVEHGDLFLMCGNIQSNWTHAVPPDDSTSARYSLTCRSTLLESGKISI